MVLFTAGAFVLLFWALLVWQSLDRGVAFSIVLLPFGMFAVATLPFGGLSPLASHIVAALTLLFSISFYALSRSHFSFAQIHASAIPLLLLGLYGVFSATILVRYFSGDILVFSFAREADGVRVNPLFRARLSELQPNPGNISQTGYLLLSIGFFILVTDVARRRGVDFVITSLRWAAGLNILMGTVDYIGLEALIEPFRTANYSLLNEAAVAGIPRAIGGFSEASSFGAMSASLFGFLFTYGFINKDRRDILIGAGCGVFAALSLSTTAFIGLGTVAAFFIVRAMKPFVLSIDKREAYLVISGVAMAFSLAMLLLLSDVLGDLPWQVIDKLFISKSSSLSGQERGAMALQGLLTFIETGGLGAGVGSGRANGLVSAMLAAMGLPGLFLYIWFLKTAVIDGNAEWSISTKAARRASQCGVATGLSVSLVSSFSVDPGLLMMAFAAIAATARDVHWEPREVLE